MQFFGPCEFSRQMFLLGVVTLLFAGCGGDLYEKRLNNTILLYKRYEERNAVLAPAWSDAAGIRIRFPKQFKEIEAPPAPEPVVAEAGVEPEVVVPPPDMRLPENSMQLPIPLPGLRGAFKAEEDGAFIFVMSSHGLKPKEEVKDVLVEEPGTDPKKLISDLRTVIGGTLSVDFSPAVFENATFPSNSIPFVAPVAYTQAIQRYTTADNNYTRLFSMYCYTDPSNENVQVVILAVEPADTAGTATKFLELGLETLQIDSAAFSGESAGGGAGAF